MSGPELDDWQTLIAVKTNLESVSEIDILTNSALTRNTRLSLITERRGLVKSAQTNGEKYANWTTTQEGKLALETITSIDFGSMKISGMGGMFSTNADVFSLKRKLFEELEKLPIEERRYKSVDVADRLVAEYNQNKASKAIIAADQKWYDLLKGNDPSEWNGIIQQQKKNGKTPPPWLKDLTTNNDLLDMAESLGVKI